MRTSESRMTPNVPAILDPGFNWPATRRALWLIVYKYEMLMSLFSAVLVVRAERRSSMLNNTLDF